MKNMQRKIQQINQMFCDKSPIFPQEPKLNPFSSDLFASKLKPALKSAALISDSTYYDDCIPLIEITDTDCYQLAKDLVMH